MNAVTRWQTGQPSYEQLERALGELHRACGVLYAALAPFSGPRPYWNDHGTAVYGVTAAERMQAHAARIQALHCVTACGLTPPLGPQPAPPTVPMHPRQGHFGPVY